MANKYNAIRTEIDGLKFDSKKEAERYQELKLMQMGGLIRNLRHHHIFTIELKNQEDKWEELCTYKSDFDYHDNEKKKYVVEDVKSPPTRKLPIYRLKKKLMQMVLGIVITET